MRKPIQQICSEIREFWDVSGIITHESNPVKEWNAYKEAYEHNFEAQNGPIENSRIQYEDFDQYIEYLKEIHAISQLTILQKIASDISGYSPFGSGARNDYYYELKTEQEKISLIQDYAIHVFNYMNLSVDECKKIISFLDKEHYSFRDMEADFENLS